MNVPKPFEIICRLLVLAGRPHNGNRDDRGQLVLQALLALAPTLHDGLVELWNAVIPKLLSYLEGEYLSSDSPLSQFLCFHYSLNLSFFISSLSGNPSSFFLPSLSFYHPWLWSFSHLFTLYLSPSGSIMFFLFPTHSQRIEWERVNRSHSAWFLLTLLKNVIKSLPALFTQLISLPVAISSHFHLSYRAPHTISVLYCRAGREWWRVVTENMGGPHAQGKTLLLYFT